MFLIQLMPVPGLDGSKLLARVLRGRAREVYVNLDEYLVLFILLIFFLLAGPLLSIVEHVRNVPATWRGIDCLALTAPGAGRPGRYHRRIVSDAATGTGADGPRSSRPVPADGQLHLGNSSATCEQYVEGRTGTRHLLPRGSAHDHDAARPARAARQVDGTVSILIAAGLDPERCTFPAERRAEARLAMLLLGASAATDGRAG